MQMALQLILLLLVSQNANADQLANILNKHKQTLGRLDDWRAIETIVIDIDIKEPSFQVEGSYCATRDGKMRIDIFSQGKPVFSEAYNGKLAWQWSPTMKQPKIIDGEKSAALKHGVELPGNIFTLLDMQSQGHSLEYIGEESREEGTAKIVLLTLKDSHKKYYLLDADSGKILANRDQRAFHPDIDSTVVTIESRPSDYALVKNMNRSMRTDNFDLTNQKWLGTTTVTNTTVNAPLDYSMFELNSVANSALVDNRGQCGIVRK